MTGLLQFPEIVGSQTVMTTWGVWASLVLRLAGAAVLGLAVSALYCYHRRPAERTRGFSQALILLAPLITMVTMAVGSSVAAAFTLVGALAIVRFRTAVQDTRDTVYVIFAVAVGMAMGQDNSTVALAGTAVVALVILGIRLFAPSLDRHRPDGILRLAISPPDPNAAVYGAVLRKFDAEVTVLRSSIDRSGKTLALRLRLRGVASQDGPALVAELLAVPDIVQATFSGNQDAG